MLTRRRILSAGAVAALSGALSFRTDAAGAGVPFFKRHALPIGIQLYTLAPDLEKDYAGTLKKVAAIGYRTVELAGLTGPAPSDMRTMLDAAGLECRSIHIMRDRMGPGPTLDDTDAIVRAAETLGLSDIVMPVMPVPGGPNSIKGPDPFAAFGAAMQKLTVDDYRRIAEFLNVRGRAFQPHGLRLGYHNHNFEFAPLDGGEIGYDILLRHTDPAFVHFEMDAGWLVAAGQSPLSWLRRFPHRFTQMHVKDVKATTRTNYVLSQDPAPIGEGVIDWKAILPAAVKSGVSQFYVEEEPPFVRPRLESMEMSFDYLSNLS